MQVLFLFPGTALFIVCAGPYGNSHGGASVYAAGKQPRLLLLLKEPLERKINRTCVRAAERYAAARGRCGLRQHRTIPALRLKHRSGSCGTASALPKCSIMSGCGTRIVLRGQKPLALCDRCPCFGSLFPPLAALTFAASSIICAFGLASAAPRSPYRHLELCGIALAKRPAFCGIKLLALVLFQQRPHFLTVHWLSPASGRRP